MNLQLWSWILTVVGVTGFILAGRKVWWCWYVNIGCQALWLIYAVVSHQYGFIVASFVYTIVFTQNAIKWTKDHIDPYRDFDLNKIVMPTSMIDYQVPYPECYCNQKTALSEPHPWFPGACPSEPVKKAEECSCTVFAFRVRPHMYNYPYCPASPVPKE